MTCVNFNIAAWICIVPIQKRHMYGARAADYSSSSGDGEDSEEGEGNLVVVEQEQQPIVGEQQAMPTGLAAFNLDSDSCQVKTPVQVQCRIAENFQ